MGTRRSGVEGQALLPTLRQDQGPHLGGLGPRNPLLPCVFVEKYCFLRIIICGQIVHSLPLRAKAGRLEDSRGTQFLL